MHRLAALASLNPYLYLQEPKLTTFETSKTPLTLLVAFPKHSESEHRPKVMRCGHKPPEETALTGKTPSLPFASVLTRVLNAWQYYLRMQRRRPLRDPG